MATRVSDPIAPRLGIAAPPDELLERRLRLLGLRGFERIVTHRNRRVMLSWRAGGPLRVHQGYALAPDRVLAAIVRFVDRRTDGADRRAAERIFLSFPVHEHAEARPRRQERTHPADAALARRLSALHSELNDRWFGGTLGAIAIRVAGRMRVRLGELVFDRSTGKPVEIAIARRHVRRDGWLEVEHTMLHEMVHQWQAETGLPVDHGPSFRHKANEVGIVPRARRMLDADRFRHLSAPVSRGRAS